MGKSLPSKIWFFTGPRKQAPDGPILLGNVIIDKRDPDYAKNELPPPPIGWHLTKRSMTEGNKSIALDKRNSQTYGIFTSFSRMVLAPSLDVEYNQSGKTSDALNCDSIEQTLFEPDEDYIKLCMQDPAVKKYLVQTSFGRPVYIITGIAVARGAARVIQKVKDRKMQLQVSVDTTLATGVPATFGVKTSQAPGKTYTNSYDSSTDFVLGVTLTEVKVKKDGSFKSKNLETGDFHERILLDEDALLDFENYSIEVSDVNADDVAGYGAGLQPGYDVDGEECSFIYFPE